MSSTENKMMSTEQPSLPLLLSTPQPPPNPSLPDDLLLSCFARVSRLYYPTLSLVSKRFRSLITSPELYKIRSLLGHSEICLYVCFEYYDGIHGPNTRWFTLCRKPDQTLNKNEKSSGYVFATLQTPNYPPVRSSNLVAVGSNIYNIGGSIYNVPLSKVSILDCRSHTWREGPSMQVERYWSVVNVLDEKIYVAGGCQDYNSSNWMEVFDPKTQTWEHVLSPLTERCGSLVWRSAVLDEEIYMYGTWGVAYKPKEDRWKPLAEVCLELGWLENPDCVIDDILFCYSDSHGIRWYDSRIRYWLRLQGLDELLLPMYANSGYVKLANYGGKMAFLWDKYVPSSEDKEIWCAVINLERHNFEEMWGEVEWLDVVLTVPFSYAFVSALVATV
ncbi:PREDICTED: F-box/kelch-repeat protein At5g49000-like [Camelina sativa]|uniref:F-box/kelch-repeat protein At5g49000-like n=1 Tax=Camelina sativa TaxID=90675 RepID=A0ABM0ZI08_CAMSA|nr:PREDICTED: F-box/kelch-repeat protein At5g49000-like [Camelina sativa]